MLLVPTYLDKSDIQGIGLFAKDYIPEGTMISKFQPGFDLVIPKDDLLKLSSPVIEQVARYSYQNKETLDYILCSDDQRFVNHADEPNVLCKMPENSTNPDDQECYAVRDIHPGEEITNDYREFDMNW